MFGGIIMKKIKLFAIILLIMSLLSGCGDSSKDNKNTKEESIEDTNSKFIWGVEKGQELTEFNRNFKWIKDVNLFDGVNVFKPHYRLVTWLPLLRKRMDYIAVLEK